MLYNMSWSPLGKSHKMPTKLALCFGGALPLSNTSETLIAVHSDAKFIYLALAGGPAACVVLKHISKDGEILSKDEHVRSCETGK